MFVVDSCCNDDDMDLAAAELQEVLSHSSLESLPLLVLANKQDVNGARSADEVSGAPLNITAGLEMFFCFVLMINNVYHSNLLHFLQVESFPGYFG